MGFKGALTRLRGNCRDCLTGGDLFLAGLLVMPALVFNPHTPSRVLQFLFLWFLAALTGKKTNPPLTLLVILGILIFNLMVPYGRVLFSLGGLRVTSGALDSGIRRAATLEGLIMLSRLCIRPDLRLPGAFGALVGESLGIFARIAGRKHLIRRDALMASLDQLLTELSEDEPEDAGALPPAGRKHSTPGGICLLVLLGLLVWLPWVFRF
jgi:heptaprenyl diphosphate synthase